MWWKLFRNRSKLKGLFVVGGLVFLVVVCVISLAIYATIHNNSIAMYLVKKNAERVLKGTGEKIENQHREKLLEKHPELNPEGGLSNSGQRGHGLSLLLIDKISTESYVKELLSMYRDSEQGKLTDTASNMPVYGLLGIHYNETGTYPGTIIPRSYLPFDSKEKKIYWKTGYKGAPAEAMTLSKFNNVAASLAGITIYGFDPSHPMSRGTFVNSFQIDKNYFSWIVPAKITGYQSSPGRKADVFYLPDSLSYINGQYNQMNNALDASSQESSVKAAMYAIWHNAGSGNMQQTATFGVEPTGGTNPKIHPLGKYKQEYSKNSSVIAKDLVDASKKYGSKLTTITKDEVSGAGLILLLDSGYYLSDRAYQAYTTGLQRRDGVFNRSSALINSWKKLKGETLTKEQMAAKLRPYVKSIPEAYPGYATNSQVNSVYGDRYITDNKGAIFKLSEHTSPAYRNKLNGKEPRVLHLTNAETVGQMFSAATGEQIYESLLKLSGVNVDETNPSDYVEGIENEFIPSGAEFDVILKKIGVTSIKPMAKDMLEEGFRVSGFWYNFGGKGELVNQKNYSMMDNAYFLSNQWTSLNRDIYKTKDGSNPAASAYNRRDENLVNLNKLVFDCSGLVTWAYNKTIGKALGKTMVHGTSNLAATNKLVNISKSQLQPGDILVKGGVHTYFFLGWGNGQSLSQTESKTEKAHVGRTGYVWALEAAETGTRVGVRARKISPGQNPRRFVELQ